MRIRQEFHQKRIAVRPAEVQASITSPVVLVQFYRAVATQHQIRHYAPRRLPRRVIGVERAVDVGAVAIPGLQIHDRRLVARPDREFVLQHRVAMQSLFHADEHDRCVAAAETDERFDAIPIDGWAERIDVYRHCCLTFRVPTL